jgi:hypothetical protein
VVSPLAAYRERRRVLMLVISLAVNIGLNFLLIPPYGPTGRPWVWWCRTS